MQLAAAELADEPKTDTARGVALLLAAILLIMAVAQLFSFEKFIPLVKEFGLPGGEGIATLIAGVIVTAEVFALPFLLRMRLSPLMRVFSMVCGWVSIALWLLLSVWINVSGTSVTTIGFLGTSVAVPVGWWAVAFMTALGVLSAWTSWGMWPLPRPGYQLKK